MSERVYCNLHDRYDCTLCDECGHDAAYHLNAHPDRDDIPAIFDRATCWAENLCLACAPTADVHVMDAVYPLRLPLDDEERARVAQAVREDDWPEAERPFALAACLICDACGEPADVRDPTVRAFHEEEARRHLPCAECGHPESQHDCCPLRCAGCGEGFVYHSFTDRPAIERYGTPEHEAWLIEMEQQEG